MRQKHDAYYENIQRAADELRTELEALGVFEPSEDHRGVAQVAEQPPHKG